MGFKAALEATKTTKTAAKKVNVATLMNIPNNIKTAAATFLKQVKAKKEIEADLAVYGEEVAEYVRGIQDEKAFKGDFANSYKLLTDNGELTVTTKNVFKINAEDGERIKEVLGDEFDNLITEKLEVILKPEVLEDEKLQDELLAALGEDGFAKFFTTFTSLKVKDNFDERVYEVAKKAADKEAKLAEIRSIIQPSKSTLK